MLIVVSIVSVILAGMGIGGGSLFVIFSTLFLNFDQKYAQLLNLIMFIAVGISATISNLKDKKVDFKIVKKCIVPLIIGAFIGTKIFYNINSETLKMWFSIFLVCIGIYEIITSLINIKKTKNMNNK